MNAKQIKKAIELGERVYWSNLAYEVIKDNIGQWLIKCNLNDHCMGLTWQDGTTLNGDEADFFTWGERDEVTDKLVGDDIEDIVMDSDNNDYLRNILIGSEFTPYGAMPIHELNKEWQERLMFKIEIDEEREYD